ncbi:2-C-methyl-D-erythritol 2,4-cyclodiphosphate synthase, partial [Bacillus pumilus]|uniref:2-C-methyl-D-erythritol 2,4-cyclodiphosphate synthase n=1 Tax=Bacillus pumilus TaxID=1408 RepID=UPI001642C621
MLRIGEGFDVDELREGRGLIMGGVRMGYEKGLVGDSEGDVVVERVGDGCVGGIG